MKVFLRLFIFLCLLSNSLAQAQELYELGVGDRIKISVFEEDDMSFELTVDDSGIFSYPYLGDISLIGKTTAELENELVSSLKGAVLVKPNISVSVVEYRTFSIGGEVKEPGSYPYSPNLTVKQAINLAGGVTDWSNGKRFKLERSKVIPGEKFNAESLVYPDDTLTILARRF